MPQPHRKRQWGIGQVNGGGLARLEAVLDRHARACNPRFPVVCFDERP